MTADDGVVVSDMVQKSNPRNPRRFRRKHYV
jgi:hypothetical protein